MAQNQDHQRVGRVLNGLRQLVQGVRQASLDVERTYGVSGAQLFVLLQLRSQKASSINELAERTMTHQSSVSVVVTKLEQKALVRRVRSRDDARRVSIELTAKGRRLIARAPSPFQERLAVRLGTLPDAELDSIVASLDVINRAAGWKARKPGLFFETLTEK